MSPYRTYDPGPVPAESKPRLLVWITILAAMTGAVNALFCLAYHGPTPDTVETHCTRICEVIDLEYMTGWPDYLGPGPEDGTLCVCGDRNAVVRVWPDGDIYTQVIRGE